MPDHSWVFPARLMRVIDGDTIVAEISVGFNTYRVDHLRLLRINAPEVRGETKAAGDAATAYVTEWLATAGAGEWPLLLQTFKSDVFGRYLVECWRVCDGANLSDDLLSRGYAVVYPMKVGG